MAWNGYETKMEGLITEAAKIFAEYEDPLTLRQVYYRLVAKDLIENKESNYKYLSKALVEGRLSGRIPFEDMEDRTRAAHGGDLTYLKPKNRLRFAYENFTEVVDRQRWPRWKYQPHYVEVWVEKQALERIVQAVAEDWFVTSFACKGYVGYSALKDAAVRFESIQAQSAKERHIIYLGDFDPSGKDIERFISEAMRDDFDIDVDVERIALTRDQIEDYRLPPQPAKRSDARFDDFVAKNGNMAVELDALEPPVLKQLIDDAINEYYNQNTFDRFVKPKEDEERKEVKEVIDKVEAALKDAGVNIE